MLIYKKFEKEFGLAEHAAAIMLGLDPKNWDDIKKLEIEAKQNIDYSIEAHMLLSDDTIQALKRARLTSTRIKTPYDRAFANFEKHVDLGPTKAAKFLGLPYSRYNTYKNGSTKLTKAVYYSMKAHQLLREPDLTKLKLKRDAF